MAATPQMETRSPLTLLNIVPKEHEKAIKQAFYNTAANIFVLLACAAAVAVYFILEAFLRPLLWAVLCGAFLNPFKRSLTNILRGWLNGLNTSGTPFILGLIITPVKFADKATDIICFTIWDHLKLLVAVCAGVPALYVLWHFGPLWSIVAAVQAVFFFTYDLLGYFSTPWVWTLVVGYVIVLMFLWESDSQVYLRYASILVWLVVVLHVAAATGFLRVPLFIFMIVVVTVGFVAEQNEARRQRQEGGALKNRQSMFDTTLAVLMGNNPETESPDETDQSEEDNKDATEMLSTRPEAETIGSSSSTPLPERAVKPDITKPSSLNVKAGVTRRVHPRSKLILTPSQQEVPKKTSSLSDQCFIGLLWAVVLTRIWMHLWLVSILLPIPIALFLIKKLGYKLCSPDGPLGDKVLCVRRRVGTWIKDRKDVLLPRWLRGVARLVMKGDQKIITVLELSVDKATSILFILLLLVGSTLMSVIFAIQVQQESMYLVKTTSSLLNNTLHPEMENWLPNNEDLQKAMDSMVGNAYVYGRNWIASKVRDFVDGNSGTASDVANGNSTHIEIQVLEMWDRLYESWLARNETSTAVSKPGQQAVTPFDISNLTSIWDVVTKGGGFNLSDVYNFVKENIGTFLSVLESIWLVLKGNMSLVISVLTSTLSALFGGGTALLNFVISSAIFLTTLFYLLASSGDQYKPIVWFAGMSPTTGGNTFGQAVQDAVGGVFMASLKMAAFYGIYTWLTHTLFGVNIVFIPSALAAVFAAVPFLGTYLAAIPAVLELWLVQDKFVCAILLLVFHFLPTYVVDTAIYSEIKGGHPYMTGLAIAGGMYWIGLEGAIFGPIILCCLIVLVNVYSTMIKPESPGLTRSQSII